MLRKYDFSFEYILFPKKVNYLLRKYDLFIQNNGHGGGGLGHNILIDPHRTCQHVKCVLGRAAVLGFCQRFVCRRFVFLMMLHARGNLDLASLEELLTSSQHSGP